MKKVILTVIAIFLLLVMGYTTFRVEYLTNDNKELEDKIIKVKKDTDTENKDTSKYKEELDSLENESSDKVKEYNIWKKAVERLEKAL